MCWYTVSLQTEYYLSVVFILQKCCSFESILSALVCVFLTCCPASWGFSRSCFPARTVQNEALLYLQTGDVEDTLQLCTNQNPDLTELTDIKQQGEVTSDLLKQWAAETTHSGLMTAPPHAGMEAKRRETCQGHECAQASWPPMMRVCSCSSGLKLRIPASSDTQTPADLSRTFLSVQNF